MAQPSVGRDQSGINEVSWETNVYDETESDIRCYNCNRTGHMA